MPAVRRLGDDWWVFWERFRACFRTRTRDTSAPADWDWRGQLTMEDARNFANIERRLHGGDGQALQQFTQHLPVGDRLCQDPFLPMGVRP